MSRNARGFALIDLIFVCGIIGVIAGIALPRLLLAKSVAGSASAIGSMRAINSAQLTFALTCGAGFYAKAQEISHAEAGGPSSRCPRGCHRGARSATSSESCRRSEADGRTETCEVTWNKPSPT